jgi:hypothetical protein
MIPGVTVTATNVDSGVKSTTATNDTGAYNFPALTPGRYTLSAFLAGFKPATVSNLNVGDAGLPQDLTLELVAPQASANLTAGSCSGSGILWCALLHRAK